MPKTSRTLSGSRLKTVFRNVRFTASLWPLLLGVFPAFLLFLHMKNKRVFLRSCVPLRLWRSGVAAITMASLLRGVFEIAGTDSIHTVVLFAAGLGFLAVGGICMLVTKVSFPVKKMDH